MKKRTGNASERPARKRQVAAVPLDAFNHRGHLRLLLLLLLHATGRRRVCHDSKPAPSRLMVGVVRAQQQQGINSVPQAKLEMIGEMICLSVGTFQGIHTEPPAAHTRTTNQTFRCATTPYSEGSHVTPPFVSLQ